MEKTAIEWLKNELKSLGIYSSTLKEKCKSAKEIEKQQIINAFNEDLYSQTIDKMKYENGEQYYNQKFNK